MNLNLEHKYNIVNNLVNCIKNDSLVSISRFLGDRIFNIDSYVMMLGETSSGKSTLINGLMQENNLFVSSAPSTGCITEVEFKENILENEFYAINKDATIETINKNIFNNLLRKPDDNLQRVKLITKPTKYNLKNMRLFDTPGYGSIIDEHEEILKEFIPNSDIIIYTVNYKIGIQENDYLFLKYLKEIIRDDVEIILVINRCPNNIEKNKNNDRRIKEIKTYVKDITHSNIKIFLVKNEVCDDEFGYALPKCEKLWQYVEKNINSPERYKKLQEIYEVYIIELLYKCEIEIQKKYENIKLSKSEKEKIKESLNLFSEDINRIKIELVEPTFSKLIDSMDSKLKIAKQNIIKNTLDSIDNSKKSNMEEMVLYVSNHLLQYYVSEEIEEVRSYIEIILENLDQEIQNYLDTSIIKLQNNIEICFSTNTEIFIKDMSKNYGTKIVYGGLTKYFAKYGGAGGAGAGIANAASHYLKVVGNIFNKRFSLATHNALKSTLKKIGATSIRTVAIAAGIIIEVAGLVVEYSIWKMKLKNKCKKAIYNWHDETLDLIKKDLINLKNENLLILDEFAKDKVNEYNYSNDLEDEKHIVHLFDLLNEAKRELGVE